MNKMDDLVQELAIIAGFLMFGFGLYQVYPPLMWIICGLCLIAFGWPRRRGD